MGKKKGTKLVPDSEGIVKIESGTPLGVERVLAGNHWQQARINNPVRKGRGNVKCIDVD